MENETIRVKIGMKIRYLRQEKGISVRELADLADVNKSTIVNLEAGRFDARLDTLQSIANALGKEVDFV